jgi:hypothetical protein
MIAVDNAVVAGGQQSREDCANIAMLDSTGRSTTTSAAG